MTLETPLLLKTVQICLKIAISVTCVGSCTILTPGVGIKLALQMILALAALGNWKNPILSRFMCCRGSLSAQTIQIGGLRIYRHVFAPTCQGQVINFSIVLCETFLNLIFKR